MIYVDDEAFQKELDQIFSSLTNKEALPFDGKIHYRIVKNVLFLAHTEIIGQKHRIFINQNLKRLLKTRRGRKRSLATLAHEFGHLFKHYSSSISPTQDPKDLEFLKQSEVAADQYALRILEKIYPGEAKLILLEQAENSLKTSLENPAKQAYDVKTAKALAKIRIKHLLRA